MDRTEAFREQAETAAGGRALASPRTAAHVGKPGAGGPMLNPTTAKALVLLEALSAVESFLSEKAREYHSSRAHLRYTDATDDAAADAELREVRASLDEISAQCDALREELTATTGARANETMSNNVLAHRLAVVMFAYQRLHAVSELFDQHSQVRVEHLLEKRARLESRTRARDYTPSRTGGDGSDPNPPSGGNSGSKATGAKTVLLERENALLQNELTTLVDKVRATERQLMEIAQLQQVFSAEILRQYEQVEAVYNDAVHATENIRAGNENVYEYASSNVGYRIYLLTFLLVASFAVLFLHWYTP